MRLSEMGPGRDDAPLPAEVEAELSALDAALAGDDVPAGMEGLEALVSDLRAERSTPESEFGDALDRWAAAGFPRGRRPGLSHKATASDAGGRFRLFLDIADAAQARLRGRRRGDARRPGGRCFADRFRQRGYDRRFELQLG